MMFTHPLARNAKVWPLGRLGESGQLVLVVVTTLKLDPKSKGFKADMVETLSTAAAEWVSYHQDRASSFMLVNRAKDW